MTGAAEFVDDGATVVVANTPGTITTNGPQRVLVALVGDGANNFLGSENEPATIGFRSLNSETTGEVTGEWLSSPGVALGLYVARYDFEQPGQWEVRVKGNRDDLIGTVIEVTEDAVIPEPGDPAPPSDTPTASTGDEMSQITTDLNPEPSFYRLSIADAVSNGRPTVIVFSTPAFCQTALCGPTIEIAKSVASDRPNVDFVHVEPFDIGQAREGTLSPIATMTEWGLVTEPWVFVVDSTGVVTASFEGIIGQAELENATANL